MTGRSDAATDLQDEIAQLRRKVDDLIANRAPPFVAEAAGRAKETARESYDMARERLDTLSARIRERPLTAVLVAAGLGYVLARGLRR
jgi:ElaB/YqjD/DUF883 family membrane-anchored ribosome-binding protein